MASRMEKNMKSKMGARLLHASAYVGVYIYTPIHGDGCFRGCDGVLRSPSIVYSRNYTEL